MPAPLLEPPVQRWECAHCNLKGVSRELVTKTPYHTCHGLKGVWAPMVLEEHRRKTVVRTVVREDYVGNEVVTTDDDGRPIMAVETVREDGSNDVAVFAPCATTRASAPSGK